MGLLFTKLWGLFFSGAEVKVIIVGLDNAGKTTILYRLLMGEAVVTSPTIGSNVEEVKYKNIHFVMWDIGGQESLRNMWSTYYTDTKVVILVVDSVDRERLSTSKEELYKMLGNESLKGASLLVFANKQDVEGRMSAAEITEYLNLSSIKDHAWHIQPCCGVSGDGLYAGLDFVVDQITK
eukprot:comp16845_c0_seq1/m.15297 comp16845_c0_seq1/g.15297  ORF comp16845_c0_seq1/g.15297 comp16845_c0_seq1/m.15297 type:complete len:180 (-) comp16845_c0_seq1:286-825(-)